MKLTIVTSVAKTITMVVAILLLTYSNLLSQNDKLNIANVRGQEVLIDTLPKPLYIITHTWKNCASCFTKVEKAIKELDPGANIIVLFRVNNDILSKRKAIQAAKPLFETRNFYFDIHSQKVKMSLNNKYIGGYMGKYDADISPSIIYSDESKEIYIENSKMFSLKNDNTKLEDIITSIKDEIGK